MCPTCGDLFCARCISVHKRLSSTRHHTVEEMSSLTAENPAASCPSFCAAHADEISEVHCSTYGASICLLCTSTDHRQCPKVTKLETKVEETRAALAEMAVTLSAGETELERAISQLDQHLRDTEARGQLTCGWGTFRMPRDFHGLKVFTRRDCPAHLALVGFESELSFS